MSTQNRNNQLDVLYGQQPALYTSQFMVNAGVEELVLDCMSGVDPMEDGTTVVPVHTKLALSWGAVERLSKLLNEAIEQRPDHGNHVPAPHIRTDAAKLPSFGETNA